MSEQVLTGTASEVWIGDSHAAAASPGRRVSVIEILLILGLTAAYLFPFTRLLHRVGDEGTIVYGAQRVLEGAVPYRAFVEVMGPGSFYWLAFFFKLFGDTWQVSRLCLLFTAVAASLLVYWIARQHVSRAAAVMAWFFSVVLSVPLWPASNHHLYSNLFALSAVAVFFAWQKTGRTVYVAMAGCLAAITSCFIQQKGLYLLVALVIVVRINWAKLSGRAVLLKPVAILAGSYALVGGSVILLFYRAGALEDLIDCTFRWPLTAYHNVNAGIVWNSLSAAVAPGAVYFNSLPVQLGLLFEGVCLIPFLLLVVLPGVVMIAAVTFVRSRPEICSLLLPALAISLAEMHRKEIFHLAYGAPLLVVSGVRLLGFVPRCRIRTTLFSITAVALILVGIGDLWNTRGGFPIETRRGTVLDVNSDDALVFLNSTVPRGEYVFVYPYYPLYYYLADVRNPTRYSILMYQYNTAGQFEEVIQDLKNKRVRFVLWDTVVDGANLRTWFPGYVEPPATELKLEHYLETSYQLISIKNGFRILKRKE